MNPYERWRQAVWIAGVVISMLLTGVILLTILGLVLGWLGAGHAGSS